MGQMVQVPLWLLVLIVGFAAITFASHFLFPSVRWFFRRRLERAVRRLNARLERPIEPFKLMRRADMVQRIIYDRDVLAAVADHADTESVPENVAFELAERYAREIVPSFSAFAYFRLGTGGARWLARALYRVRLGHYSQELSDVPEDATVIFVMNHRSNMDYVLVTYLAAERSALSYAVGEWARVWPLSRLIKMMGAYFIRRKSRNALYRKVLATYVRMATEGGVTQAIFPEGGLSLDGKLAPPKLGLLAYALQAYQPGGKDIVFVPVALNYDRVLEDRILIAAGEAGERRFRGNILEASRFVLRQIRLRLTGGFHSFGYAAVSFGAPLAMSSYGSKTPDPEEVAHDLMQRIGDVVPVVPVPLITSLLLEEDGIDRFELERRVRARIKAMPEAHIHIPRDNIGYTVEVGLRTMRMRRLITEDAGGKLRIVDSERSVLAYYAGSIAHLKPPP